ncbi:MAG TPA: hypothetical protein PKY97_01000, partial [Saprospiraceae bacterium]|nr:hypothetical protein [Saprospiraceae bacterium]
MIRFSCNISLIVVLLCWSIIAQSQVVFYGLSENTALVSTQSELEQRNLIQQSRVVVIPSDSQSVCVNRPDVGTFDTLIMTSTVPTDLNIRIENNCVKITAHSNATVNSYDLAFNYIAVSGAQIEYRIKVDVVQPLTLPFFDDFAYDSKYPDPVRWVDNNVYVNNTMADMPPSIGVATFDGLNSNGTPYGGSFGRSDYLTSAFIDLSSISSTDPLYLSFYLQPKGKTYNHQLRDSMELEFKNA